MTDQQTPWGNPVLAADVLPSTYASAPQAPSQVGWQTQAPPVNSGWQPTPPPYNGEWPPHQGQQSGTDGAGVASLVLGILWLGGVGALLAVIFGHLSRGSSKKQGRPKSGMALAGLILGYVGLVGAALVWIVVLTATSAVFQAQRTTGFDAQTKSDIRNLATTEETYYTDNNTYTSDLSALTGVGFTQSPNDRSLSVTLQPGTSGTTTYCISGTSDSGTTFYFRGDGGDGVTTTPCN